MLHNVILVTDLDTAVQVFHNPQFHGTVVTKNGEMIDPQGMVFGGSTEKISSNLLTQNREMEELTTKTDRLKENVQSSSGNFRKKQKRSINHGKGT